MFTVKATYRGETRKFTFPECNSFPSFDQLYRQLYRVFPISHNFFLSKLLFSPDSSKSRVLVSREVHTAEEYASCVAPFLGKPWSNPLLRFSVFDETPHKQPSLSGARSLPQLKVSNPQAPPAPPYAFPFPPPIVPFGSIQFSHIPPPPIIFSTSPPCFQSQDSMDVDSSVAGHDHGKTSLFPQSPGPRIVTPKLVSCCAVAQTKTDLQSLITDFKADLDRIITSLGTTKTQGETLPMEPQPTLSSVPPAPVPPAPVPPVFPPLCQFNFCWRCGAIKQGPWFDCEKCANKLCVTCHESASTMDCFVGTGPHVWKRQTCARCPETSAPLPAAPLPAVPLPAAPTMGPTCGSSSLSSLGFSCLPSVPTMPPVAPNVAENPLSMPDEPVVNQAPMDSVPSPVIHRGVACDVCHFTIAGTRHKCLDCPDYDLCSLCISSGSAERHNPFHEFIELAEPGRVVVHTVFSGQGEREAVQPNNRRSSETSLETPPARSASPAQALHNATCDMCDSRIRGDRYKCMSCPDYDVCGFCFMITEEQHPHHGFVKLARPEDFIRRESSTFAPYHLATCDSCSRGIIGVRYKCMHPECPDFDLCESCESLPIPVHPINHPMLKLKVTNAMIPSVYRVGQGVQTQTPVPEETESRGRPLRSPGPLYTRSRSSSFRPAIARSRSSSYESGYLRNPTAREGYQVARISSPEISPPSPFYFKSEESSRSQSRCTAFDCADTRSSSPVPASSVAPALPPSPPMRIPGSLPPAFTLPPLRMPRSLSPILSTADQEPSPVSPNVKIEEVQQGILPLWKNMYRAVSPIAIPGGYTPPRSPSSYPVTVRSGLASRERSLSPRPSTPEWRPVYSPPAQGFSVRLPSSQSTIVRSEEASADAHVLPPVDATTMSTGFWPENFQEIRHLMEDDPLFSRDLNWSVAQAVVAPVEESPLIAEGEPLLNRPASADKVEDSNRSVPSLASILNGNDALVASKEERTPPLLPAQTAVSLPPATPARLSAAFVADRSVPDGQVFPPGAEFMKSWSMLNDGDGAWPDSTELVFVGGDALTRGGDSLERGMDGGKTVKVGAVESMEQVDLWTGELKAPDVPGRYVSYYRLRDGEGRLFGHSIWLDITVSEASEGLSGSEEYLSTSSLIVMPNSADQDGPKVDLSVPSSPVSVPSSTSVVSMPEESDTDSDEELWEDSRQSMMNRARGEEGEEYVVLYESSEED